MAFINTVVGRAAASIWGLKLGNATMSAVLDQVNANPGGFTAVLNQTFNSSFGSQSNAVIADAYVTNLALTGQARTDGMAYVLDALNASTSDVRGETLMGITDLFLSLMSDPVYGSFATEFNAKVTAAVAYSSTPGTVDAVLGNLPSSTSFNLTLGQDNITGTAGNDTFNAYIFDNSNTWQSGDYTDGGAGTDTLYADMGSSQNFAVTPITRGIENIVVRAQSRAGDTGDNNVSGEGRVIIDAERIEGELRYESNNSRADLIYEDVRIGDSQITKDITVAMVQTDPGNVDFGLYFDQHSLRANTTSSASLTLQLLDQKAAAEGAAPLRDSPYDGFRFSLNGTFIQLTSQAFNDAQTYAELLIATQALLASDARTNGVVTAALGSSFTVTESSGVPVSGTSIVLSANNATFGVGTWIALAGVPAESSLYTNQFTGIATSNDLVTSTVVLDDVGRGSNGGDLVIGGLSVGETSSSAGVDRFEITVERTSRLQNIDSTNNWLKEVTVKNGTSTGNLTVLGNSNAHAEMLPGAVAQHDTYGFNDVRLIDGSALTGSFTFDALIGTASFGKYVTLTDTQSLPGDDNVSVPGKTPQRADFTYAGGGGNDSMTVVIDGGIAASNSTVQAGREDFTFVINGNNGNDSINLRIIDGSNDGLFGGGPYGDHWYQHQKLLANVSINGGAGNDTIRTPGAGDVIIGAGDGDDNVYADNSGGQAGLANVAAIGAITNVNPYAAVTAQNAVWVFNTKSQNGVTDLLPYGSAPATALAARDLRNILSDTNDNYNGTNGSLFAATVTVDFMGLTSSVNLPQNVYRPTDLHVNQAIKSAINNNAVLNKLIVAQDGPGYSLVVKSLIDGTMTTTDLSVTLTQVDTSSGAAALSDAVVSLAIAALDPTGPQTRANLQTIVDQGKTNFDAAELATGAGGSNYVTQMATDGTLAVVGAESVTPSDNKINPGAGNDVIVLGTTTTTAPSTALESSNDRVIYNSLAFGNDVIVNFELLAAATLGNDTIDFTGLGGKGSQFSAATGGVGLSGDLDVVLETVANDTAAEIAALYTNDAVNTSAQTWVVVTYTAGNVGKVYQLVDAALTGGVTATFAGSIDLADTLWSAMAAGDFSG